MRSAARLSPWVSVCGVMVLLIGLSWDAVLHALDAELAAREGVFTIRNPGHALFAVGIGLTLSGVLLFLAERVSRWRVSPRSALAHGGVGLGVLALAGIALVFGLRGDVGIGSRSHAATDGHTESATVDTSPGHSHTADVSATAKTGSSTLPGVQHSNGEAVAVTAGELIAAAQLAADVRVGTARFADFNVARAEGYIQITGGRGGLAHFHNQAYFTDGRTVDPERPEQLMYLRMPDGAMRLVGVMFLMPSGEAGPRIGGALTAWHSHNNLCYSRSTGVIVALTNAAGQCPAGSQFRGVTPEMMHVWLVENPNGVFSDDMEPAALLRVLN